MSEASIIPIPKPILFNSLLVYVLKYLSKESLNTHQSWLVLRLLGDLGRSECQFPMKINKLVAPSTTHQSNKVRKAIHQAMHILSLLYNHSFSQRETMFLHCKGKLHQILIWLLSQHRSQDWPLICHILSFLLTFSFQGLARNATFANGFHLWYLYCFNISDGFFNVPGRVIIPLIFCGRRWHHCEKWLVTWCARHGY